MLPHKPSPFEGEGRPKAGERGYSKQTLGRAKSLRREMTEAEIKLWQHLRAGRLGGYRFRKQQPIGSYIADFLCAKHKVIVEADGSQHHESAHDEKRDGWLNAQGYNILRFWNCDILNDIESVKNSIYATLDQPLSKEQ